MAFLSYKIVYVVLYNMDFNRSLVTSVIIILIIVAFTVSNYDLFIKESVQGFWVGDEDFCEEAGLDTMILYIDEPYRGENGYYLLAKKDDEFIINSPGKLSISISPMDYLFYRDPKNLTIEFNDSEGLENLDDEFPSRQMARLYIKKAKLVLYHDDVITGVFYKDGSKTEFTS
jgi:hypothetical protein